MHESDATTEDTLSMITDIEASCDMAIQMLNELLDYEKLESGIMTLDKKEILAWPIVNDTVGMFQVQVCHIKINITTKPFDKDVKTNLTFVKSLFLIDKNLI